MSEIQRYADVQDDAWKPRKWRHGRRKKIQSWDSGFLTDAIIDEYISSALEDIERRNND